MRLVHLTERATWAAALRAGEYRNSTRGRTLDQQGFIHCSLPRQLRSVAEYVYGDCDDDLVLLVIDSDRLAAPVRFEAPPDESGTYPHIYGPVPTGAVVDVIPIVRDATGRLILPEWADAGLDQGEAAG